MSDELPYIENEEGKFAVPCQIKIAEDCAQVGKFCETKEDARDWVEHECWIGSGEGFFAWNVTIRFCETLPIYKPKRCVNSLRY